MIEERYDLRDIGASNDWGGSIKRREGLDVQTYSGEKLGSYPISCQFSRIFINISKIDINPSD
jgi:hypothetical protein